MGMDLRGLGWWKCALLGVGLKGACMLLCCCMRGMWCRGVCKWRCAPAVACCQAETTQHTLKKSKIDSQQIQIEIDMCVCRSCDACAG